MNLKELRTQVKNITDYVPELQTYDDNLDKLINDAYLNLWGHKRWNFAQKKEFMNLYPDLYTEQPTALAPNITADVTDNERQITFSSAVYPLDLGADGQNIWEGQIIEVQGREFVIDQVISSQEIRTREAFRGVSNAADATWKIKHRYYKLNPNTLELLSVAYRDVPYAGNTTTGKLLAYDARSEEAMGLQEDNTADYADSYILTPPTVVPSGENISITILNAGGAILDSTYFECCWAFITDGGKVGPLSESAIANTAANPAPNANRLVLNPLTWDNKAVQARAYNASFDLVKSPFEGMRKIFFFNSNFNPATGERKGLPCWRVITKAVASHVINEHFPLLAQDVDASITITAMEALNSGNKRYDEFDGQHLRIRPYPRPIGYDTHRPFSPARPDSETYFRQVETRYYYKPLLLANSTDTPELPYEFHQLIVYGALADVFIKNGNGSQASHYEKRIDKAIKQLEKRYTDNIDVFHQRGSFSPSTTSPNYQRDSLRKV